MKEILEWMLGLGKRSLDWILGRLAASFFSGQLREDGRNASKLSNGVGHGSSLTCGRYQDT